MNQTTPKTTQANRDKVWKFYQALTAQTLGYDSQIRIVLNCMLTGGHTSALGPPGSGKTRLIKTVAHGLGNGVYSRIQFVPDLLPSDVTGSEVLNQVTGEWSYKFGPLNPEVNILLADEINRTPPRVQAALLEPMEEGQITTLTKKKTLPLNVYHFIYATQNPIDVGMGTWPLPAAELDRFTAQIETNDTLGEELELQATMMSVFETGGLDPRYKNVIDLADLIAMRDEVRTIHVSEDIARYAVALRQATRPADAPANLKQFFTDGVSIRASRSVIRLAMAHAWMEGNDAVSPDDIKAVAPSVYCHRFYVNEQQALRANMTRAMLMDELLKHVKIMKKS